MKALGAIEHKHATAKVVSNELLQVLSSMVSLDVAQLVAKGIDSKLVFDESKHE